MSTLVIVIIAVAVVLVCLAILQAVSRTRAARAHPGRRRDEILRQRAERPRTR